MPRIDLQELSKRESKRVDWKETVADINEVIKTIVAFANDFSNLGGGYVICGAREGKDEYGFQRIFNTGLTADIFKEIEGKVLRDCREKVSPPIVPLTEEIVVDEKHRQLIFIVSASRNAHSFRAGSKDASTYYIRSGKNTIEARNGLLTELLIKKNQMDPWDKRSNRDASRQCIDLIILREYLQEMKLWDDNKPIEDYFNPQMPISTFVPPLMEKVPLTNEIYPRNFSLLLFGKEPLRFFPGAYTIFSKYPGTDRSDRTAIRHEITGTIVQQARRTMDLLAAEAYTIFDKTSSTPNQEKYPLAALQEALINALVHRDYESSQPTRITSFIDRIEIYSPGPLPMGILKKDFRSGKAIPQWRNQTLAYFFNKLQLAQGEGQGMSIIIRLMKGNGCPLPKFQIRPDSILYILYANPRYQKVKESFQD